MSDGIRATPLVAAAAVAFAAGLTRHPIPLALLLFALIPFTPRPRWFVAAFAVTGFVMNGLFSWHGATVWWQAGFTVPILGRPRLTAEAAASGLVTAIQIAIVALAFLIAFQRTNPQALARLMPGAGPRLATRVALRALPEFADDARAMRAGLAVRGVETAGVRGSGHILVPLVARSLDRTMQTIEILHARGAGARPRPSQPIAFGSLDVVAILVLAMVPVLWITGAWPDASFFPRVELSAASSWRTWVPALALAAVPGVVRPA